MSRDDQRKAEIFAIIGELAEELGWVIGIPTEGETVPGLVIGSEEFVLSFMNAEDLEVYEKINGGGSSSGTVH